MQSFAIFWHKQAVILERALNYLIINSRVDIDALNGKTIGLSLQDLPLDVHFVCANNRIFVFSATDKPTDVDIKLKSMVFISLLQGEGPTELFRQNKINIHGDVKTAQLLLDLLKEVDIDLEEMVSKHTGDIIANQLGKLTKKFNRTGTQSNNPFEIIKDGLSTLLINPIKSKRYKHKNS
ncbi:SCP2 sterol-binding domain-containing protein [Candidatus Ruthia endofausta]|uniref:SCP2 sterol-binding domain-containing protein n=1 Tax=Candidatus Ruthia endofausta TaxID=2738852 RepID=A0A6N0HQG7_9GAMM|nr:SCP2 sterol-binding domain-containing protein [Candidatus Ruthia endofausta]QKQ24566.1 SCP2 sterol-binding domain-containing protein [Candidatus Ruthia endofausta]